MVNITGESVFGPWFSPLAACCTQDGGGSISADELADLMETLGIHAKKVNGC
jgi:hypothetical protein